MTVGIVKALVKCGALPPKKSGPANPRCEEEAKRIKLEKQTVARRLRQELIREAQEKGEPLPVFKVGRPRKYTPEEAKMAKATQNRMCMDCYNERLRQGIVKLEALYGSHDDTARSTDEHFFVDAD